MEIVVHRVNSIKTLRKISSSYGCEIDIRANGSHLILNHEPFKGGDLFTDYLDEYSHGLLVLNIKEAGIEDVVLKEVRQRNIPRHFLLDVEFPYIYRAARAGERAIAMRFSEDESIETAIKYKGIVDWIWIDTITKLPLSYQLVKQIKGFKTCLVCPERWGRSGDVRIYQRRLRRLGLRLDAVMTAGDSIKTWGNITS